MFYYITLPFASFYDGVRKWFWELFPIGGGWTILSTMLFFLLMLTVLYFSFKFLVRLHRRDEYVKSAAGDFTYFHIAAGVFADIVMLVKPEGAWNIVAHIACIGWLLAFFAMLGMKVHEMAQKGDMPHRQVYYWLTGIIYGMVMFVIGMYAFMSALAAIVMAISIILVVSFLGAGARASLMSAIRGGGSPASGSSGRTATLENGTVIKEIGTTWYAENGTGTYRQNFDGSFTKTN